MNSHLVSKVLLRRWADERDRISVLDLATLERSTDRTEVFAAVEDLLPDEPTELEQRWNSEVEMQLPHPLKLVEDGSIFEHRNAQYVEVLKRAFALHWGRSFAIIELRERYEPQYVDQIVGNMTAVFTASEIVRARTGLAVPEGAALEFVRDDIGREFGEQISKDLLPDLFESNRQKATEMIGDHGLEIGVATDDLLIGDCPVVTVNKAMDSAGTRNGVGWMKADAIFMPIGPHHVIALSQQNRIRDLPPSYVVMLNRRQVEAAYKEVYFRTASGLGNVIADALRTSALGD